MLAPSKENTASLPVPVMDNNQQAMDLTFSSPPPPPPRHNVHQGDEVLDLRVCRPNETTVKSEYCTRSPSPTVITNHQSSSIAFHPSFLYSHIPLPANVNAFPQPLDIVPQPSTTASSALVSSTIPMTSSSVSLQPNPIASVSGDSMHIPCLPQYMLYHHTPSSGNPLTLQSDSSPENSLSDTSTATPASPPSAQELQPSPFPLLHQRNTVPSLPTPTSAAGDQTKKCTRPFKAVSFTLGEVSALYSESFGHFKDEVYAQAKPVTKISGNKKKRTVPKHYSSPEPSSSSEQSSPKGKDAAYLEKRRKNNEAAKRSRDARRAKEDELALWKAFLEQENQRLRYELMHLKKCGIQIVAGSCVCKPLLVRRDLQQ